MSHWRTGQAEAILARARARGMIPALSNAHDQTHHTGTTAALERNPFHVPLAASEVQEKRTGKVHVRVSSVRKRLADPDGLCEKFVLDCCRYAGLIADDSADDITLETTQRKAAKGEEEHTEITITYPEIAKEALKL